jgi:glycine C-acetyltransferase
MQKAGFDIPEREHPIVPVMYGVAPRAKETAERLLEKGVYVIAFSFPVVPRDKARIRVQLSAAHTEEQIEHTVKAFAQVRDRA